MFTYVKSKKRPEKKRSKADRKKPREVSSKIKPSKFKQILPDKKRPVRDPRFDDLSGKFNKSKFNQAYSFLDKKREKEIQKLKKELNQTSNEKEKEKINQALNLITQENLRRKAEKEKDEIIQERRKKEKELIKQGKKPYFLKKSEEKNILLISKYNKLKSEGKLDQFIAKRRKRNAAKEHKYLPERKEKK
ncbi:hypothetical protein M0811_03481 [Anaeramoeba ignava]|uniref:rRNA biogenesis protein RRP36 n=1 Tax=Anaeramoeba ignava TaxID=1746090 RepID=A0A9Q0R4I2_ANAIG|nr:hypothetical protein M0811_03481 [Anaeramoeba ignava]